MDLPQHNHAPGCRAVNFCPDTGRYTGTRAFDAERCAACRREEQRVNAMTEEEFRRNLAEITGRYLAELRRSNAAGRHADKRTRRRRTRKAARDAAIRED